MNNYKGPGETLTLTAPYDVSAGDGAQVGSIFGVACEDYDYDAGDVGEFLTAGEFTLTKTSAQAWTVGQKIYWDNSTKKCDSDSTVGMLIGYATATAANPTSTGQVRLNGSAPSTSEGPQAAIVALTDSTGVSGSHDDTLADGLNAVAPAAYTAHSAGATPVTSAAATDLDTTAAAVANLRSVLATVVSDLAIQNQNDSDLAQKILEIRTALIAAGIIAA